MFKEREKNLLFVLLIVVIFTLATFNCQSNVASARETISKRQEKFKFLKEKHSTRDQLAFFAKGK